MAQAEAAAHRLATTNFARAPGGDSVGRPFCSNRRAIAPALLQEALHVELPAYSEMRLESADLTDVVPAEYRADLVVLLVDGKPVLGIVVEVQLQPDARKSFSWPVYVTGLRARLSVRVAYW